MPLTPGTRFGPYEVAAQIGAGGMGAVYRAIDPALGRAVAIKVLPDVFASDPERLTRFEREARTLASLSHPNIATVYGFHDAEGVRGLVMELIEGPTLADRIAQGPIPLDEALPLAKQIADALEAAHEQGIIHRDLKPANVKVRPDGTVKVLDFGLAKALETTPAGQADATLSPTITSPATRAGVILGTAAYMAPEQARGRPADRRSDVWAFGSVLYEMLTGRRAFSAATGGGSPRSAQSGDAADDVADTLAAVLRAEPEWSALPGETPSSIRTLLVRCLQKDPRKRLPQIGAARLELEEATTHPQSGHREAAAARSEQPRQRLAWTAAAVAAGIAALLALPALRHWRESPAPIPPEARFEIPAPESPDLSVALSPDGRHVAFVAAENGRVQLWVRALAETIARPLPGTEDARFPFWSADSRSIGFFSRSTLRRIDLDGGAARTLGAAAPSLGASWNVDDVIVFGGAAGGSLARVSASGGEVTPATTLEGGADGGHSYPWFLPDQRQFVFFSRGSRPGLYLGALDSQDVRHLTDADSGAVYAPQGWLLFVRDGALVAHRFDAAKGTLHDDPVIISGDFGRASGVASPPVTAAASGTIAYRSGVSAKRQLAWFNRSGTRLGNASPIDHFANPAIGPDGRIAVERVVENNADIWILDRLRMHSLTSDAALDRFPIWSHDASSIFFSSDREGRQATFTQPSDRSGRATRLLDPTSVATDVSTDGRFLLFMMVQEKTREDIGAVPLDNSGKPFAWLDSPFTEMWAQFAPGGSWAAYQSLESRQTEIFIRPFPGPGGRFIVSTDGGIHARWAPDGRELYYIAPDGRLMAVPVDLNGPIPDIGEPTALFTPPIVGGGAQVLGLSQQYDVAADGRFLINVTTDESRTAPITVLLNWNPDRADDAD